MINLPRKFSLLLFFAVLLSPVTAVGQAGGLIRKAKGAVKAPNQAAPAAAANPRKDPYADPRVVPITVDVLVRFEKALKFEVTERDAIRKERGPAKTPEEYKACSQNTSMSPQAQQLTLEWAKSNQNAPPEQFAKSMEKMQADLAGLIGRQCGEDPAQWLPKREARLSEVAGRASDIAMPDGWAPRGSGEHGPSGQSGRSGPWLGDEAETPLGLGVRAMPHPYLLAYAMLKERVVPYCVAVEAGGLKVQVGTGGAGVRVPLSLSNPDAAVYVYSNAEVAAQGPKCPSLMTWLKQLLLRAADAPSTIAEATDRFSTQVVQQRR